MRLRPRMWLHIASSVFVMVSLAIPAERIGAQSADLNQAKKEGEVAVFGTLENDIAAALHKGFEAKYGIKTNYFRGSSTVIIDRVTSEHRTGKMSADAVFATAEPMKFINKEKGLLVRYISPSARDYNKQLVDGFFGPNYRSVIIGFLYNKSMIKPEDAPKTYEDLSIRSGKAKLPWAIRASMTPPSTGSQVSLPSSGRRKRPPPGSSGSRLWNR
jgi:spermidine/putrescine-binding protein